MKSEKPKSKLLIFILGLSFALPSMGLCQAQESPTAGQVARKVTPVAAKTVGQKAWMKLHPAMSELRQKRVEAFIDHVNEIRNILNNTRASIDAEPFAERVLGYEGLYNAIVHSRADKYIEQNFTDLLLDTRKLTCEIQKVYDSFHVENAKLTEAFLVKNKLDVDIDPNTLNALRIDSSFVTSQMSQPKAVLVSQFHEACQELFLAKATGFAASGIGQHMSHLGDDEYGNPTIASGIWGFVGALASEALAENVTLNAFGTKQKVATAANQAVNQFLSSLSGSENSFEGCDRALIDMFHKHEHLLLQSVVDLTGVDADFANQNLPK